jgi:homoserine kinase type II
MRQNEHISSVLANYDMDDVSAVHYAEGGTRNQNYEIWCKGKKEYFLRQRKVSSVIKDDIEFDHSLMDYLSDNDIIIPSPMPNVYDKTFTEYNGSYYELSRYIDGHPFSRDSKDHLIIGGKNLARFHSVGESFRWKKTKSIGRIDPPGVAKATIEELFQNPRERRAFPELKRVLHELDMVENELNDDVFESLPQTLIHGDFHPGNIKYLNEQRLAFFDLDWVSIQPRLQDLAYGILFFASLREDDINPSDIYSLTDACKPSIKKSSIFISAYNSIAELSREELDFLPYFIRVAWICCRTDGSKKVSVENRLEFFKRDILTPLESLDELKDYLIEDLYPKRLT